MLPRRGQEKVFDTFNPATLVRDVKRPETLARELRPLNEVGDNYPKYLIVGDYGNAVMHNGIHQVCVQDFLLRRS